MYISLVVLLETWGRGLSQSVFPLGCVPVSKDELLEQSEVVVSTSSIQKNKILDNKKNRANFVTSSQLIKEKPSNSKDASGVIDNSASPLSYRKAKEVVSLKQP